jgi:hypothetical protein
MTGAVWAVPPREHDWDQVGVTELRASLRVRSMRRERVLKRGLTVRAIASSSITHAGRALATLAQLWPVDSRSASTVWTVEGSV